MTCRPGTRIGIYDVLSPIGRGGMGEVWKARDTKLNRDVALKVLPGNFTLDHDRLVRFKREAQVLASLNHPHIAAIYGFEESDTDHALVLELVEGATLADRIARGPIPVDEALLLAKQIAEALEAAHEQGIIHRDLKPANIKVRADGTLKVLDFGLAKVVEAVPRADDPTRPGTSMISETGIVLGTPKYMAPEQAKGAEVDRRADIWAFGCVLFEMLAGKHPLAGDDTREIMAAILRDEPQWTTLPPSTPHALQKLLQRCLKKDPKQRLQAIGDARIEIVELLSGPSEQVMTNADLSPVPIWQRSLPWAIATAALTATAVILIFWAPWRKPSTATTASTRLSIEIGVDASIPAINPSASLVLSADGSMLAFTAVKNGTPQLYLRHLDQLQSTLLDNTIGARDPFFSPDGQWIAFFADGKLKKVPVTGSAAAIVLCDAGSDRGGTWTEEHTIIFQSGGNGPLSVVPDSGGQPMPLTTLAEGEFTERWPQILPGGKAVLYTAHDKPTGFEDANIVVRQLPNGAPRIIQRGGYFGRYLASGHLVYIHNNTLFAATFDVARMELTGSPVQVLEKVAANATTATPGAAAFAASESGTAVYLPAQEAFGPAQLEWLDRMGKVTPLPAVPSFWIGPRFSPDGRQIALVLRDARSQDVWVYEWARDTMTRLTSDGSHNPVWSADGRRVTFRSQPSGKGAFNLYWKRADGSGPPQQLTESKNAQFPFSWHPSGRFLAFYEISPQTGYDIMILPMEGDETSGWRPGKPTPFLNTPATETAPMFSPDGRWIAYMSNESGRAEVYVRPFPGPGDKWQISTQGGANPLWSRARHELVFNTADNHLMVASYTVEGDSFHADKPKPWTDKRIEPRGSDLHPDGERMVVAVAPDAPPVAKQSNLVFIPNFFDELRRLAPTTRR